jgi:hypothetical protein
MNQRTLNSCPITSSKTVLILVSSRISLKLHYYPDRIGRFLVVLVPACLRDLDNTNAISFFFISL